MSKKMRGEYGSIFTTHFLYLGFNTNPKNGRVKALSKACLDRTYYSAASTIPKNAGLHS